MLIHGIDGTMDFHAYLLYFLPIFILDSSQDGNVVIFCIQFEQIDPIDGIFFDHG